MKIKEAKRLSKDLEKFSRTLSEATNRINSITEDMKNLRNLIGTLNNEDRLESRLVAAGITCIISPDPVSDIAGVALVITGTLLRKVRRAKIVDVIRESRKLKNDLKESLKILDF